MGPRSTGSRTPCVTLHELRIKTQVHPTVDAHLKSEVKSFLVSQLRLEDVTPESIGDDEPLAEGTLGLDSIDFLELTVALEKHYGIKITEAEEAAEVFASVNAAFEFLGMFPRFRSGPRWPCADGHSAFAPIKRIVQSESPRPGCGDAKAQSLNLIVPDEPVAFGWRFQLADGGFVEPHAPSVYVWCTSVYGMYVSSR